jgi:hypothetical protein
MKDKINIVLLVLVVILGIIVLWLTLFQDTNRVGATRPKCEWTEWVDITECTGACGTSEGTKTQEKTCVTEECTYECPVIEFKYNDQIYNVPYEKSSDPHKCHRPSDSDLEKILGSKKAKDAFKKEYGETLDSKKSCENVVKDSEQQVVACEIEVVACEPISTPTPTPNQTSSQPSNSSTDAPGCGVADVTKPVDNPHVYRKGDTAIVKWWNTAGDKAIIYYKQVNSSDWQYSVVVANTGYFEIRGLGNMDVSFAITQVDSCSGGVSASAKVIVDGNAQRWVLFR